MNVLLYQCYFCCYQLNLSIGGPRNVSCQLLKCDQSLVFMTGIVSAGGGGGGGGGCGWEELLSTSLWAQDQGEGTCWCSDESK